MTTAWRTKIGWGYFVRALRDQEVAAIGGPNISPPSDNWVAKCAAASPGNPSHVMLDDRRAEHVPGCNMAVWRDVLFELGGFDPQFRQAGDDADFCWRLLDAGYQIGFAPGAMVWHHRRNSVSAYFKQQRGYGRAEAMVFKHPQRFGSLTRPSFRGIIYGEGAAGFSLLPARIYHGRFGSALFQTIYRNNEYSPTTWMTLLEWHLLALFFVVLSLCIPQCTNHPDTNHFVISETSATLAINTPTRMPSVASTRAGRIFWLRTGACDSSPNRSILKMALRPASGRGSAWGNEMTDR